MKRILIAIILILILILLIAVLAWMGYSFKKEATSVITYKTEYSEGENPKIKIMNDSEEKICFSSCYPYYLERSNGAKDEFKSYQYGNCQESDVVKICLEPNEVKAFEILLDDITPEKGLHRIAIPTCIGCALQEKFRQDQWFYSNEFVIK